MRLVLACATVALVVLAPVAAAQGFRPAGLRAFGAGEVRDALLLGAPMPRGGGLAQLAAQAAMSPLDRGESRLLHENLADAMVLLSLPRVPTELLQTVALQQVGGVVGPHVGDVPTRDLFAANALLGPEGTITASSLRDTSDSASIGNEPADQSAADMAAMLGTLGEG
ncbi:MAG: hypothetical protein QOE90_3508 [Thermoplasmata archaeon]|jgi:hypothetical protein|nr:hypothetical protein [Thermoplasmata archaeon]